MDILQPLPVEKWTLLRETVKEDWPNYANYYNWISNAIKWKKKDPKFKVDIFCPHGKHDTGVFVGIFHVSLTAVAVFSLKRSRTLLKETLSKTKLINWNTECLRFNCNYETFTDIVEDFVKKHNCNYKKDVTELYFKPKEECLTLEYKVPEECRLGYLDESHVDTVHSTWHYRLEKRPQLTYEYLRTFVVHNRGVGLFLKKDNTLVSWILNVDWGGLGMLHTVEEHRGKGYGLIVTKAMIRELAEKENLDSTCFVVPENTASRMLFTKSLGFKTYGKNYWFDVERIASE